MQHIIINKNYQDLSEKGADKIHKIGSCCCCLLSKSCPTLLQPVDCSPPGSSVHGLFQARILEGVAISFSRGSSWSRDQTSISCIDTLLHPLSGFFTTEPLGKPKIGSTAAAAKSLQSCPTLCDPIDRSPPGSPVPGILQARTLEWVAISFSNAWKWKVKGKSLSRVWLLATPWTEAYQAPPSMGFSRQSTGVGCHCLLQIGSTDS